MYLQIIPEYVPMKNLDNLCYFLHLKCKILTNLFNSALAEVLILGAILLAHACNSKTVFGRGPIFFCVFSY